MQYKLIKTNHWDTIKKYRRTQIVVKHKPVSVTQSELLKGSINDIDKRDHLKWKKDKQKKIINSKTNEKKATYKSNE